MPRFKNTWVFPYNIWWWKITRKYSQPSFKSNYGNLMVIRSNDMFKFWIEQVCARIQSIFRLWKNLGRSYRLCMNPTWFFPCVWRNLYGTLRRKFGWVAFFKALIKGTSSYFAVFLIGIYEDTVLVVSFFQCVYMVWLYRVHIRLDQPPNLWKDKDCN